MQKDGSKSREFWKDKRVVVTGGAGFLGSVVVRKLQERKPAEVFVPRSSNYDLRDLGAIRRMLSEARPHLIIHLAARVGGIGANRAHPAGFFYDNLTGLRGEIVWDASKPDGQPRRCLDSGRAERGFGFVAQTSLREGLSRTIDWYRRRLATVETAGSPAAFHLG